MALRKIEALLADDATDRFKELMSGEKACPHVSFWVQSVSGERFLISLLVKSEDSEAALDFLENHFAGSDPRILVLPVEATLPRLESEEEKEEAGEEGQAGEEEQRSSSRISREELYSDLEETSRLNATYLVLVALAAVVAAIGILRNDVAVVVGAMVIAPLLGPNVALSLATTLGDLQFARRALKVGGAGLIVALILSLGLGLLLEVDPTSPQIASRTRAQLLDIVLALAAGTAGALSFTVGIPAALVGVMVAVALLPPLVVVGMLIGSGDWNLAFRALLLTLTNLICVNLAGVITFLVQGIRPSEWYEQDQARRATRIAIASCLALLVLLATIMVLLRGQGGGG